MNKHVMDSKLIIKEFNIKVIPISYKNGIADYRILSLRKIITIITLCFKLIKELLLFKPQIVYFQVSPTGIAFFRDLIYILIIRFSDAKILYHIHGKGIQESISKSLLKRRIYIWAFRKSSVVFLANSLKYDFKDIFKGNSYVVNNAVDLEEENKPLNDVIKSIRILFFSNLLYSKGIIDYLDALKIFTSDNPEVPIRGIIVGQEADLKTKDLGKEISIRSLDGLVTYLGSKFSKEKQLVFCNSDILIYPSYNDAFPLVLLEAMQAGMPIIATKEGAIPEIVDDGITGFLVDKHHSDQIAKKLEILINNPELRKKLGDAGRKKFLEKYTLEIFESNMKNVFEDVLRKGNVQRQ